MKRRPYFGALAVAVLLLSARAAPGGDRGGSLQLYLRESAWLAGTSATIGDLATVSGGTADERSRLAGCSLGIPFTRPTLLPARVVRAVLAASGAATASVSGSRCVVIPGLGARESLFFETLLLAIAPDLPRDARVEIELLAASGVAPETASPGLCFAAADAAQVSGSPAGPARLRVSSGPAEGHVDVWVFVYLPAMTPGLAPGAEVELSSALWGGAPPEGAKASGGGGDLVRGGDTVTILFRKGGIAISALGRALGGGALTERVTVRSTDGGRTYVGTVVGSMEVAVDMP